jgi:hypothetical protein
MQTGAATPKVMKFLLSAVYLCWVLPVSARELL